MRANFLWTLVLLLPSVSFAQWYVPSSLPTPAAFAEAPDEPAPVRSARLLNESLWVAAVGLALPMATYVGVTQTGRSFPAFFAGFSAATLIGLVGAPVAVSLVHGQKGGKGRWTRALLGALIGVAAGTIIGLPLSTLPNPGYHAGLALFWALPSTLTLVALEWG